MIIFYNGGKKASIMNGNSCKVKKSMNISPPLAFKNPHHKNRVGEMDPLSSKTSEIAGKWQFILFCAVNPAFDEAKGCLRVL
jgi:hypothetical protein